MSERLLTRFSILLVLLLAGGCVADHPGLQATEQDELLGEHSVIGGGSENAAPATHATVGGGWGNTAGVEYSVVAGGESNTAAATRATVGGGYHNLASHLDATVAGGAANTASGTHTTVGGGSHNLAAGRDAAVSGGYHNTANGIQATIGGGARNVADGFGATVAGGDGNSASALRAAVGGGLANQASGIYGTVAGGYGNQAGGAYSAVPGGFANRADGDYGFAAGRRAAVDAAHDGTFLYADGLDLDFGSLAANEFAVRATGGVRFVTAVDAAGSPTAGARLAPGSGSWSFLSDQAAKSHFIPVDGGRVLARLAQLPIATWSYRGQDASTRHMGPTAQGFYAAFGLGEDEHYISAVDADGVALAAIQGLYGQVQEQDARIATLERRIAEMEVASGRLFTPDRLALCLLGTALGWFVTRRWGARSL